MKSTDNKKAPESWRSRSFSVVNNMRKLTMSSLALSFNEVNFSPVAQNGQIWLTAPELASALGYSKSDAVGQVYERNKDEFNSSGQRKLYCAFKCLLLIMTIYRK